MKNIFFFLLLFCCWGKPLFVWAEGKTGLEDRILVISSYSPLKEGGNHMILSFLEEISPQVTSTISVEYMDSESYPCFTDWKHWLLSLFEAYEVPPRLVVLIGGEVWSVYRKYCPEKWMEIPVVLGGVKHGFIDYEEDNIQAITSLQSLPLMSSTFEGFQVTGYYLTDYFEENISLIKRLQPQLSDFVFCYDDRYHFPFLKPYLLSLVEKLKPCKLHYWVGSQMSTAELVDSIVALPPNAAIMSAGWYTDSNRYSHAYSMLQNELSRQTDKWVYEIMDQDFSALNYIGGYFVSGVEIGKDLAHLVYQVWQEGWENSPGFGPTPSLPKYHLNYAALARLGVDASLLPPDVAWYNKPLSWWEVYGFEMAVALVITLLVLVIISLILIYRWRHEQNYIQSNRKLQHLLKAMPDMAIVYDKEARILDIINPHKEILLWYTPAELIGCNMKDIIQRVPEFEEVGHLIEGYILHTFRTQQVSAFSYKIDFLKEKFCAEAKIVPLDRDKVICFVRDITSRVVAETEADKYKNFLQSIIDHLPLGIFVKNVSDNYRYIYYNQSVADFYENKASDYLGKNDFEAHNPWAELYRKEDEEVLKSGKPLSFEREITDKAGVQHWAVTTKTKLLNNDGSLYLLAILVDITYLRKNEMELENIRNELSIALDAGSLAAWNFDVRQQMFYSLYRETGTHKGLSYEKVLQMVHPEDQGKCRAFIEDLVSGKVDKKSEIFRFSKSGVYYWCETYAAGIRSTDTGEVIQVVGTEKDITEELKRQKELEESKFKTDLVIQSNGIVQWDYDVVRQVFSSLNKDSFMHNGISMQDYYVLVHPEDRHFIDETLQELVEERTLSKNIQVRVNFPQLGFRWVDIHAVVFKKDKEGKVVQITGLRRDITEWKNLTEELITLRNKAEESNRLKTAFLANMSHEIRTPLNAIVGFSSLIAQTDDPAEVEEYCKLIGTNNDLLLQLINDILDLSKIEAGQLDFVFSEVQLSTLFEGLQQMYQFRKNEEVEFICALPAEDGIIYTEKNRVMQVLSNFLTNAIKFTLKGYIKMGYELIDGGIRFYVTDTGKGIAEENIPRVFDRFMKFDAFIQGTGLGLSICKTIVQRLGGEIGVVSELGKGSTFWFTLPVEIKPVKLMAVCPKALEKDVKASASQEEGQRMILVAEDNDSNYLLLSSVLKKDYCLYRAVNGKEAVEKCQALHPHLILMDVRMPEMDGLTATRKIRQTDSSIPIIALTANAFPQDREKALEAGCVAYLTKPVDISLLCKTIEQWMN